MMFPIRLIMIISHGDEFMLFYTVIFSPLMKKIMLANTFYFTPFLRRNYFRYIPVYYLFEKNILIHNSSILCENKTIKQ